MLFSAITQQPSAVESVSDAIREAIVSGRLVPGSRLPSERLLAQQLGVNRTTLRSALQHLGASGLLDVRQGSGYRVRDFLRDGGPDLLPDIAEAARRSQTFETMAADLLSLRRHMSRAVLEKLACGHERDISAFATAVSEFIELATAGAGSGSGSGSNVEEVAAADVKVLSALLDLTGSAVMRLCLNPVIAVLQSMPELRAAMYGDAASNASGWMLLLTWLDNPTGRDVDEMGKLLTAFDRITLDNLHRALNEPGGSSNGEVR